jgi:hypothetical protein
MESWQRLNPDFVYRVWGEMDRVTRGRPDA